MSEVRHDSTTVLRREIGRHFQRLRKAAGYTLDQAAEEWEKSRATVHRIENGAENVRFRRRDTKVLLEIYNAPAEDIELLLGLTEEAGKVTAWWHDYDDTAIPKGFQLYVGLEDAAEQIRTYEPELIPGLLQTRAYAEQVMRMPDSWLTDEEISQRVDVRSRRQSLLTRYGAPRFDAVISEAVLRRTVGTAQLMAEQLHHLTKAAELPNVSVRVVPFTAGHHAGMLGGSFQYMLFPVDRDGKPTEKPTVHVGNTTGSVYLSRPHEIATYESVWQSVTRSAADDDASHRMIHDAAEEYSRA